MTKSDSEHSRNALLETGFYWTLFVGLFSYALMRVWFVEPMLDELATFYDYIRTGYYFHPDHLLDANNHILNSFFGYQLYILFGDSFVWFRLPSLLAFPLYFLACKSIVRQSVPQLPFRLLIFTALVTIPWGFEYFSYSRGYGMAIAFYFMAIALALRRRSNDRWIDVVGFYTCLWFSVSANLSYFLPSLVLLGYAELNSLLSARFKIGVVFRTVLILSTWAVAIIPLLQYSFQLKAADALWWGNQDGLWETTGKSLSSLVLFTDAEWVLYAVLALLLFCTVSFGFSWIKSKSWNYLKQPESLFFILFSGCISGIVSMRFLLDVNYPMDRVGMYLIPVFLLLIGVFLSKYKVLKYLLIGLLFFPISLLVQLNLSTSIFSPEDRISNALTAEIKASINDQSALSAEHVSHLSYAYSCRKDQKVHLAYTSDEQAPIYGDYHISWRDCLPADGYYLITQHSESKTCFLQRTDSPDRQLVIDTTIAAMTMSDQYFTLLKHSMDSLLLGQSIQVRVDGELEFDQPTIGFNVVQKILNTKDEQVSSRQPKFHWYFSDRTDANFTFTDRIVRLKPEARTLHFFLFNNDQIQVKIKSMRVRVYRINSL